MCIALPRRASVDPFARPVIALIHRAGVHVRARRQTMLRATEDVVEIRRWAEGRGARPSRDGGSGLPGLAFPGEPSAAAEVGWDEFEVTFLLMRCVCVYDDAPGGHRAFVGGVEEAYRFVEGKVTTWGA
jgi:hypothetical protein